MKKIFSILGARPQFIKAAVVSRELMKRDGLQETLIHTGQHYDDVMSAIFFEELGIPTPGHQLEFGGLVHGAMTGRMLEALEILFDEHLPDLVLVYGDTNSTLAGALAAAKMHIPIAHVEAGLRSFNKKMPEEVNRILTDHVSALLLCPTRAAVENLKNENIHHGVTHVGDVMFDATLYARGKAQRHSDILKKLDVEPGSYALCTLHRAENTDDEIRFQQLIQFLENQTNDRPVIFSVHPRTKKIMRQRGIEPTHIQLIDPVGYIDLHALLAGASLILTDSGGLQKEAYFHNTPCITLRDQTEWIETVEAGWNRLWRQSDWKKPRRKVRDYGLGDAGQKTVDAIEEFLKG